MPCKSALAGLSQVLNFFVIDLNHRVTMLKINASNLKTWRCQNLWDLISLSLSDVVLFTIVLDLSATLLNRQAL